MSSDLTSRYASPRFMLVSAVVLGLVCSMAVVASVATAISSGPGRGRALNRTATCGVTAAAPLVGAHTDTRGNVIGVDLTGRGASSRNSAAQSAFDVYVATADTTLPAIAGRYAVIGDTVRFTPAYPFVPGMSYRVIVRGDRNPADSHCLTTLDTTLRIARANRSQPRAEVAAVYPTVDVLPMNQLKLYVQFSAPMRAGEAATRARIIDEATGHVVPDAFFSPEDELWDPAQTRLTLLFDPGRIKRGLRPNEELGLPLRAGHRYRLEIDAGWRDAAGDSLARAYVKRFAVVAPDRTAPRTALWSVSSPRVGTRDTLTVSFGEPMDDALLERVVLVRDASGAALIGHASAGSGEDRWQFVPASPWSASPYTVSVGTELEDLAGNNLRRLFDTDLADKTAPVLERGERVSLPVHVASSPKPNWLHVGTPGLRSADVMTFAPGGLLLVGDSRGSAVFAIDVADSSSASAEDVSIAEIDAKVAARLGTTAREISIRDLAIHPVSHNVYLSVTRGNAEPAIVRVTKGGRVDVVSLTSVPFAKAALPSPPRDGLEVEGDPAWKWTISAMTVLDSTLYVAGISNQEFASTVRQLPIPFTGKMASTGLRIYHAHHVRYETESPVTALAPYTFFGRRFLVAAYACTPIALFEIDSLRDGAKVTGKTIAELGGGNVVRDLMPFDYEGNRYLAVSNRNRSLQIMNATALPNAALLDEHSPTPLPTTPRGQSSWIAWGLPAPSVNQVGILHLADFDADHALAVQRDVESGALNLQLLRKPFLFAGR